MGPCFKTSQCGLYFCCCLCAFKCLCCSWCAQCLTCHDKSKPCIVMSGQNNNGKLGSHTTTCHDRILIAHASVVHDETQMTWLLNTKQLFPFCSTKKNTEVTLWQIHPQQLGKAAAQSFTTLVPLRDAKSAITNLNARSDINAPLVNGTSTAPTHAPKPLEDLFQEMSSRRFLAGFDLLLLTINCVVLSFLRSSCLSFSVSFPIPHSRFFMLHSAFFFLHNSSFILPHDFFLSFFSLAPFLPCFPPPFLPSSLAFFRLRYNSYSFSFSRALFNAFSLVVLPAEHSTMQAPKITQRTLALIKSLEREIEANRCLSLWSQCLSQCLCGPHPSRDACNRGRYLTRELDFLQCFVAAQSSDLVRDYVARPVRCFML